MWKYKKAPISITALLIVILVSIADDYISQHTRNIRHAQIAAVNSELTGLVLEDDMKTGALDAKADRIIALMGHNAITWYPYAWKGDAFEKAENYGEASVYYQKAVDLLSNPSFVDRTILAEPGGVGSPAVQLDIMILRKKMEYALQHRQWKDENEIRQSVRAGIRNVRPEITCSLHSHYSFVPLFFIICRIFSRNSPFVARELPP